MLLHQLLHILLELGVLLTLLSALIRQIQHGQYLWKEIFKPREPLGFQAQPRYKPRGKVSHSYQTDPTNRRLQGDLLTLLRGDTATAKRLLKQQRQQHPGKSDNWYLEKVIYDLERDRRC